jgi:hypothetical protein
MAYGKRALGSIVKRLDGPIGRDEIGSRAFDFYDNPRDFDPNLSPHQVELARSAACLAWDLCNISTYVSNILPFYAKQTIDNPAAVVVSSSMAEACFMSMRCAADTLGDMLGYVASPKSGQAPRGSLADLLKWAKKRPSSIRPEVMALLKDDWDWFHEAKFVRDQLVHQGANANVFCDQHHLYLWLQKENGRTLRDTPLLPFLRTQVTNLLATSNQVGAVVGDILKLPAERVNSRVLHGIMIPYMNILLEFDDSGGPPSRR